ncbi:MAG: amidohydrolase family protein [Thermoleophilaceae bacterium]
MIVDVHVHVIVRELRPHVTPPPAAVGEFVDPEGILAAAAQAGIDHVVLSPWVRLLEGDLEHCRTQNAGLAALVGDHISALGSVPLAEPELAARELRSIMDGGVLAGVEVPASVGGVYLGDDRFAPLWVAAEETGAVVFIHPTTRGFDDPVFGDFYLWNTVGNPFETTITAAHMVMAGVVERHPGLRVILAHGGGALPALRGRLRHAHTFQPHARARLREDPEASIARFYFDTITHDPAVLASLVEFAGGDHVLLGTDHPFDMGDPHPVATVRAAGLGAAERDVLGDTALRLLDREGART